MFNMGGGELILVGLAALLLIGPKKLPQVATQLGRWFAQLQRSFDEVKQSVREGLKDEDVKKEVKNERNPPLKNLEGLTLIDHLTELRSRILRSLYAVAAGSILGILFCKKIYHILQIPLIRTLPEESFFIVTTPFESYMTYFKVALLAGGFLASPVIFYQFWRFVAPGLKKNEKKYLLPASFASALLFAGGALFGYFVVFPAGFYYVNLILNDTAIRLLPKMSDYFGLSVTMLLAFGVTFELPLFIFIAGKLDLIDYGFIKRNRRYVIVALFVLAAVLTPGPDVLSQVLLALPLWALFEAGGLTLLMIRR